MGVREAIYSRKCVATSLDHEDSGSISLGDWCTATSQDYEDSGSIPLEANGLSKYPCTKKNAVVVLKMAALR